MNEVERSIDPSYVQEKYVPFIQESFDPCSCISFAKWYLGVAQKETWGDAKEILPTSQTPSEMGLYLTSEGAGHVGVILRVSSVSFEALEANYRPCSVSRRTIRLDNPAIRGFIR